MHDESKVRSLILSLLVTVSSISWIECALSVLTAMSIAMTKIKLLSKQGSTCEEERSSAYEPGFARDSVRK